MGTLRQHLPVALLLMAGTGELSAADVPDRAVLQRQLRSEDAEKRFEAALVLLKDIDPKHKGALGVLRTSFQADSPRRSQAVIDLARRNPAVVKLLIEIGVDRKADTEARLYVLGEVKELGPLAKERIPEFINCLDESLEIAGGAAEVLGSMKAEAKAAIPALERRIMEDRTPRWQVDTRIAKMAQALIHIDSSNKVAIRYFTRLLTGWDIELRSRGVDGLRDCPVLPPEALKRLKYIAEKDPYDSLRSEAAEILNKQKEAREKK